MIQFLVTRGHGYTLKEVKKARGAAKVSVKDYDDLGRSGWARRGTYVFTDIDRLRPSELERASQLYRQLKNAGLRVLNDPATVKTRYPLLRELRAAGLNDFNVYRVNELHGSIRYPVFLRNVHGHDGAISDLLPTREELEKTIASVIAGGILEQDLLVVEYAAEPVRPGLYRKLGAYRMGDEIIPHVSVHDTVWMMKTGTVGCAPDELYREELAMLQAYPFAEHLRKVFDRAHIEYGRADFGIWRGRLQIYEINTNPNITAPTTHPCPARQQSRLYCWDRFVESLRALDSPAGWPVRLAASDPQDRAREKNILARSPEAS